MQSYGNDQKIRRCFILYEFEKKKPIFTSFKDLCATMGNDFMDYKEFEFWFQRFSSGNFDLDYDTSQDPKYRTLTDLPVHVFQKIADNLGNVNRFVLRNVCQSMRQLVDSWDPKYEFIKIFKNNTMIHLTMDDAGFLCEHEEGRISVEGPLPDIIDFGRSGEKHGVAMDDFVSFLKYPKLHVQRLVIHLEKSKEFIRDLKRRLKKSNIKIQAEHFSLTSDCLEDYIKILRYIQPGVLKTVDLRHPESYVVNFAHLTEMLNESEACQSAQQVLIDSSVTEADNQLLMARLLTLPRVSLSYPKISLSCAKKIFKRLRKSATLRLYEIKTTAGTYRLATLKQILIGVGANVVDPENHPYCLIYRNPAFGSDEHFEIQLRADGWSIERKRD